MSEHPAPFSSQPAPLSSLPAPRAATVRTSALPARNSALPKGVRPASFASANVVIAPAPWLADGAAVSIRPLFPANDDGQADLDSQAEVDAQAELDAHDETASLDDAAHLSTPSLPPATQSVAPVSQLPAATAPASLAPPARDPNADAFARAVAEHATARARALASVETQLLELAVQLAEVLVERELERDPQIHATLARAALSALEGDHTGVVRASRAAHAAIIDAFGAAHVEIDGVKVDVVLDPRLEGVGVVVEGPDTRVDGRVSERLRSALRAMLDERRAREAQREDQREEPEVAS